MLDKLQEAWLSGYKKLRARWLGYINREEIRAVRRELEQMLREHPDPGRIELHALPDEERLLCEEILRETERHNRNNVTRTAAYLALYLRRPELHWAFLAHMVSRNGGYQMTDLKGEWLPRIMKSAETESFFQFLERANYLIFGDAYPQLLLYEKSRERGRPLFHLLPAFGVSRFMRVNWERYWRSGEEQDVTMALVVNEQNFIERRVVQHPDFQGVIGSFEFAAQTYLNLTQVLFPYHPFTATGDSRLPLAGIEVDTFLPLVERIDMGRRLYAILFKNQEVHDGALRWAKETPHTGSRADYWPHLYGKKRKGLPSKRYHPRLDGCALRRRAHPIYSPVLADAWPDVVNPAPAGGQDWCEGTESASELYGTRSPHSFQIGQVVCRTLNLIEKAVAAEAWLDAPRR